MNNSIERLQKALLTTIRHHYFIPFCLASAVFIRVLWILWLDVDPIWDFRWYYQRGLDIAVGKGYAINGKLTAYWPVGYPGFLGILFFIFSPSLISAKIANIILYLLIILATYFCSKKIFHSECAARISLFILSFYPNHIAYCSLLSSEILFLFLLMSASLLFLISKERFHLLALSGFLFGLATLTKAQALFIPAIFLFVFFTNTKSFVKSAATIFLVLFITIIPWITRNCLVFDKFVFISTNGGINLLIGNNPYSGGTYTWEGPVKSLLGNTEGEVERDAKAREIALAYIKKNPVQTILRWPKKFMALYFFDAEGISINIAELKTKKTNTIIILERLKIVAQIYYMLTVSLFFLSLYSITRNFIRYQSIGIIIILYFTLIYLVFFGYTRFHFPVIPWIVIYSGFGAQMILKHNYHHNLSNKRRNTVED